MLNELKQLFININNFRKPLLNEGISESRIVDAINEHKIIYIYYAGDETVLKGYRTIRPFVLGTHKDTSNKVLRAWQDAGSTDSFNKQVGVKPRMGHERHSGPKGVQPGWRLFLIDKITSIMPTGEKFTPMDYFKTGDDVKYNPDDKDMSNIDAAISNVVNDKTDFDRQTSKFKEFFKSSKKARQITKDEVELLVNIVKKYRKKAKRHYWVVQNDVGDMVLKTERGLEIDKIPKDAIIGNLQDLYNDYVLDDKAVDKSFFEKSKKNALK